MVLFALAQWADTLVRDPQQAPPAPSRNAIFQGYTDYPPEAVRHHWEGTVVADLSVGSDGRGTACQIVERSGHQLLDDATCKLLMERARFKPATDDHGKSVASHFRTPKISWKLP